MFAILLFGAFTGLALGLTGGGGTMLALPLLMYGLGLPAHDAVAVSLVAVGTMAFIGALAPLGPRATGPHRDVMLSNDARVTVARDWLTSWSE